MTTSANNYKYLSSLPGSEPTYRKYKIIQHAVNNFTIKTKRRLFRIMRESVTVNANTFFPTHGMTAGEFATWYVLGGSHKRHN